MITDKEILKQAKKVLEIEADAIKDLISRLGFDFLKAVNLLYSCKGRVIVTGIGKSGIIARKISATMASIGTPALYLHPVEGVHGDLGTVLNNDIVIVVSNSGETKEILEILPTIKRIGTKLIALTGKKDSTLAENSDVVLDVSVKEEACPLGLVPTASTTAELAMGDALSIALLLKRNFREKDYALLHPAGNLGRRLVKIKDIMRMGKDIPVVNEDCSMKGVIMEMTSKKMGCTLVINKKGELTGIITDQDLRTCLNLTKNILNKRAKDIMTKNPKTVNKDALISEAIRITEEKLISTVLIIDKFKKPIGIIHLHDLLRLSK
ncbi:MAG: KpsF/GutQ family sugar-phosphate isomerase [Candidatus Firestonebacteria bacterium]